jgi:peptidyl-prolyl cis-trans isomerase B (cyclophilin B)
MRIAILLVVGLLLVGCGGNDSNDSGGGGNASMDCEIGGDESKADLADLEDGKTHTVVVDTNKGSFTFELATDISPCTTASFAGLVKKGFFDGLTFHRIVPGFVIQGGDPQGTGMGGPGYSTVDAPPQGTTYDKGLVAMAKAGNEPAGTSGSQFFVVSADGVQLTPDYAVLGRVTDGLDVVETIGKLGNPSDPSGKPTEAVNIEKMELK